MNEEALYSLHGGIAYEGDFPKCLPLSIIQSIQGICYHYIPDWIDYIDGKELVVAFTNNLSLSVLYQKTDDNVGIILLPKGLITRAYLLTKVVFSNLDKERKQFVRFAAPIPEDYTHHEIYIPPRLRPIFASYSDANMLLSEWEELNSSITIDELNNDFVEYTTVMIVLHIIFHELGHISRGHRTFLSLQKLASNESRNFLSIDKIKRALEIDSDKIAGQLMGNITALQIQEYKEKGNYIDHLPYIAYCTGFANMLVYSIMDVETRGLAAYKNSIYPHPTVRFLFNMGAYSKWIRKTIPAMLLQQWQLSTNQSIIDCIRCFHWMVLEELLDDEDWCKPEFMQKYWICGLQMVDFSISEEINNLILKDMEADYYLYETVAHSLEHYLDNNCRK